MTSSSILVCFLTDISDLGLEYDVLVHEDQTLPRKSRNTEQKKTKSRINKSGQKGRRNNSKQGGAMRSKKHKKNLKKETTQGDNKKKKKKNEKKKGKNEKKMKTQSNGQIMLRQQSDQCVEVRFSR